jgi:hypothetical protein
MDKAWASFHFRTFHVLGFGWSQNRENCYKEDGKNAKGLSECGDYFIENRLFLNIPKPSVKPIK